MTTPVRPGWLVKVRRSPGGPVVGAGFLVTRTHVVTCVHVVSPGAEPQPVWLEFQYADAHEPIEARVTADGWHPEPPGPSLRGDIAVLELLADAPPGAVPAPLRRSDDVVGHRAVALGYPLAHPVDAVPALVTLVGAAEAEWLALQSRDVVGQGIEEGFSGGPVWDEELEGVVAMTVRKDRPGKVDQRTAYAIPADVLAGYWPPLAGLVERVLTRADRERLQKLLQISLADDGSLPRVRDADMYDIGVQAGPAGEYRPRPEVDGLLAAALSAEPFVLLVGGSGAGKSRTLIENLRRHMADARLIAPLVSDASVEEATRLALSYGDGPAVVWLDELQLFLGPLGLNVKALDRLARHDPPVTVVATMDADMYREIHGNAGVLRSYARGVLARVKPIMLNERLEEQERAADLLARRYAEIRAEDGPAWALVRAAADWNRMGLNGSVPVAQLRTLFEAYLPGTGDEQRWRSALLQAAEAPALLAAAGDDAYQVHNYVRSMADGGDGVEAVDIPARAWPIALDAAAPRELLAVAYAAAARGDGGTARAAVGRVRAADDADPAVTAWATLFLAELEFADGAFAAASPLFEEALRSPVPEVAELARLDFGLTLINLDAPDRAEQLLRDALLADDTTVTSVAQAHLANLKISSPQQQRAMLSTDRGEQPLTAEDPEDLVRGTVLRRQQDVMRPLGQLALGGILLDRGELRDARQLLEQSLAAGVAEVVPLAQANLGTLLSYEGDLTAGRELLEAAAASDDSHAVALAKVNLAWFLGQAGDLDEAADLLSEAADAGDAEQSARAADLLGDVLSGRGDIRGAREAYERAIRDGHRDWAPMAMIDLAALDARHGDTEAALQLLREVSRLGHAQLSPRAGYMLGQLLEAADDDLGAQSAYQEVIAAGHPEYSGLARINNAGIIYPDDPARAMAMLDDAVSTSEHKVAAYAEIVQAFVHANEDRTEQAEAIFERLAGDDDEAVAYVGELFRIGLVIQIGDLPRAEGLLRQLAADPRTRDYGFERVITGELAAMLLDRGDAAAAIELLRASVDQDTPAEIVEVFLDQGVDLITADRCADALPFLRVAAEHAEGDPPRLAAVRTEIGIALLVTEDLAGARTELDYAYANGDAGVRPRAGRYLGSALSRLGEPAAAREILAEVAAADTDQKAEAALLLGKMSLDEHQPDAAVAWLTRAREAARGTDPDTYVSASLALGEHYVRTAQFADGLQLLSELAAGAGASRARAIELLASITEPVAQLPPKPVPLPAQPVEPRSEFSLPPLLSVLLGEVSAAEGQAEEAAYWFALAAAGDDPVGERARTGLAGLASD
ncbi:tetratricopeptide repeat protein [Hamadaea tsunoensis]|uniref:tetratricopeptide repeat protein n=1 Tax=Hamadaea tsunoensis TaxID=53368 RepID=UPI000420E485|nr:tetratricopeptide repeat protein [Hamadaea tsunoensis]